MLALDITHTDAPLIIPNEPAPTAHAVLEYWLARLPREPRVFGAMPVTDTSASRSFVRLPPRLGFEAWLIRWPAGSVAPLHDHGGSSGVLALLDGKLSESSSIRDSGVWTRRTWVPNAIIELPERVCHEVRNTGRATAFSVHVYQPQLEYMTFYHRKENGSLEAIGAEVSTQW